MTEKTLGQIAFEAADTGDYEWVYLAEYRQKEWHDAAQAVAETVRAESQWRPIETAPRDGAEVLLSFDGASEPLIGYYVSGYGWCKRKWGGTRTRADLAQFARKPSYWRPMLEMPK